MISSINKTDIYINGEYIYHQDKQLYNIIEAQENLEIKNLKNTLTEVVEAYEEEKYLFNYCFKLLSPEMRLKMKEEISDNLKYTEFV